jgi:hypothetical protein
VHRGIWRDAGAHIVALRCRSIFGLFCIFIHRSLYIHG